MSIEWCVRLVRDISLGELTVTTSRLVDQVLAVPPGELPLVIRGRDLLDGPPPGDDTRPLAGKFRADLGVSYGLDMTEIGVLDVGYPEDEEGGVWFTALSYRDELARIISVCVAIAAAELTGGRVVDEASYLGQRLSTPEQALAALRTVDFTGAESVAERAGRVVELMYRNSTAN